MARVTLCPFRDQVIKDVVASFLLFLGSLDLGKISCHVKKALSRTARLRWRGPKLPATSQPPTSELSGEQVPQPQAGLATAGLANILPVTSHGAPTTDLPRSASPTFLSHRNRVRPKMCIFL